MSSVWRKGAPAQAAARQALEDAHGDVHERSEIKEQVVESVDRQPAGLVGVLQGHDGRVQAVSQIPESRAARLDHLLSALEGDDNNVGVGDLIFYFAAIQNPQNRTHFGYVLGRLTHGFEDIDRRRQVNVFKVTNRVGVGARIFHLGHVLHHLCLKLRVHRTGLDHRQPGEEHVVP